VCGVDGVKRILKYKQFSDKKKCDTLNNKSTKRSTITKIQMRSNNSQEQAVSI